MRTNFDKQLKELNLEIVQMASNVETAISSAVQGLLMRDVNLAEQAIKMDDKTNDYERQIERRCLKLLLHEQPVATDLRKISSALKMITDMERIGDHATDISEITIDLADVKEIDGETFSHIKLMAEYAVKMLSESVTAYVNDDKTLAEKVIKDDDGVDELFAKVKNDLIHCIIREKVVGEQAVDMLMIAKYFERIGDHAVNIAEWVLFSITGVHKNMQIM